MTYLSSRTTGRTKAPSAVNDNQGLLVHNSGFEEFRINISDAFSAITDGATSYSLTTLTGFAIAVASLAF